MVVRSKLFERNGVNTPTPAQVVLLQELERWNLLVIKMAVTLADLQRAFRGEIGMSDDLDALGGSLFNGFIPHLWKRLMPNTQKPLGSWMSHFLERYTQYDLWIAHGEPKVIWLSGLHIPESCVAASRGFSSILHLTPRSRGDTPSPASSRCLIRAGRTLEPTSTPCRGPAILSS